MTQASIGHHCPECVQGNTQQVITARTLPRSDRSPLIIGLIVVNVLAYMAQVATSDEVTIDGLLFGPLVADGEWWRIVTSAFLHSSLLHIGFNMYALWILGNPLEQMLGRTRFVLAYLSGLFGGSAAVLAFDWAAPTLGASGAVLGLGGALAAALWSRGINITQTSLGWVLGLNLALPLLVGRISFWGHAGGILAGFAAGWLLTWLPVRYQRSVRDSVVATAVLTGALATASLMAAAAGGLVSL